MTKRKKAAVARARRSVSIEDIRSQVMESLGPTISEIRGIHNRTNEALIRSTHAIGSVLIRNDELLQSAEYRCDIWKIPHTLQVISEAVGIPASTLAKARKFAELYDESDLDDLLASGLNWTHVRSLVTVSDVAARQRLANRVTNEGLTGDELSRIIVGEPGNRRSGAGRKAKPSKNLRRDLDRTLNATRKFTTGVLEVFFDNAAEEYDLPTEILSFTPPDELKQTHLDDLSAIIQHLSSQEQRIPEVKAGLQSAQEHVREVLAERERRELEQSDGDDQDPSDPAAVAWCAPTTAREHS